MKAAYEQGYKAKANGDTRENNPWLSKTEPIDYYAWLAGFNDYELGYRLDLTVFDKEQK